MSFKQHQPIETDLQEHHAWERIGITTHQEKDAVMTIIYEIFAAIVSHIQVLGMSGNQTIDGAVWYMFNSKIQRDSMRNAFVASPFLARLPANVKATRKITLKHEMHRLLECNKELFKNTYNMGMFNQRILRMARRNSDIAEPRSVLMLMYRSFVQIKQRHRLPSGLVTSCLTK